MKKAVILLSGGLDSITVLTIALSEGYECYTLGFNYGQRHSQELKKAEEIALKYKVKHKIITIDSTAFSTSALVNKNINVQKSQLSTTAHPALDTRSDEAPHQVRGVQTSLGQIPSTYVPARNTIFLAYALGFAESIGASDVFIGVNALDYSGYPDCRPEYIAAFQTLANLATKSGVEQGEIKIHTPLINLTKQQIIALGIKHDVDYSMTTSCYDPIGDKACGTCDACTLRLKGFAENGITDPIEYT